jgi:hypothetical protein
MRSLLVTASVSAIVSASVSALMITRFRTPSPAETAAVSFAAELQRQQARIEAAISVLLATAGRLGPTVTGPAEPPQKP